MSFNGIHKLRPVPDPETRLTDRWAKYFNRILDVCETESERDEVLLFWGERFIDNNYYPFISRYSDLNRRVSENEVFENNNNF